MTISYGRLGAASGHNVRLDRDEALRYLGYSGQQVDDALLARFHALADGCEQAIEPAYAWGIFEVDGDAGDAAEGSTCASGDFASGDFASGDSADGGSIGDDSASGDSANGDTTAVPFVSLVSAPVVLSGNDIASHLKGASKVALMACTLGMASEREYRRHAALSAADGAMFGACCSALVEAAANEVEAQIVAKARRMGMRTNWRYSPGYGDFPLDVQPDFLQSLDATRKLGINVTPTNMLLPVKSVTAVIGLFAEGEGSFGEAANASVALTEPDALDSTCAACPAFQDCEFRKRGCTCHG